MSDLNERKASVEHLIRVANLLDGKGEHEVADRLTRLAAKEVEDIEDDIDAENADAPVSSDDPFSKGFGKSMKNLCKKLDTVCGTNNLKKKLQDLCEAVGCDVSTARRIERSIEDACESIQELCKCK